jgi:hypothetical protein
MSGRDPLPAPEQNLWPVSASLSHTGRGKSEVCIGSGKSTRGAPSPLVGEGSRTRTIERSGAGEGFLNTRGSVP